MQLQPFLISIHYHQLLFLKYLVYFQEFIGVGGCSLCLKFSHSSNFPKWLSVVSRDSWNCSVIYGLNKGKFWLCIAWKVRQALLVWAVVPYLEMVTDSSVRICCRDTFQDHCILWGKKKHRVNYRLSSEERPWFVTHNLVKLLPSRWLERRL